MVAKHSLVLGYYMNSHADGNYDDNGDFDVYYTPSFFYNDNYGGGDYDSEKTRVHTFLSTVTATAAAAKHRLGHHCVTPTRGRRQDSRGYNKTPRYCRQMQYTPPTKEAC